jgi:hypothetical protein
MGKGKYSPWGMSYMRFNQFAVVVHVEKGKAVRVKETIL